MRRAVRAAAWVVAVPAAFVAVLVAEAAVAMRRQYDVQPEFTVAGEVQPHGSDTQDAPLRMAVLGDSTAAGLGARTVEETLAVQSAQRVADAVGRPVDVTGYAVSGALTRDVTTQQLPQLDGMNPDVVVIVIGSNDVTHATPPGRFADDTTAMLERARRAAPDAVVVLGGIPLFRSASALPQPLRWVVGRYAGLLRPRQRAAAVAVDGVEFVDIAADASPRFEGVPNAMSDGFHPSGIGYGFWADAVAAGVVDALSRR